MGFKTNLLLLLCATVFLAVVQSKHLYRWAGKNEFTRKNLGFNYTTSYLVNTTNASIPFYGEYYTGYIPVNNVTNSSLFYTLYSAGGNNPNATTNTSNLSTSAPLILWLQGGPGCSSWLGNINEFGPMTANYNATTNKTTLSANPSSWNNFAHLLFVDQPIGVGFS
eukprot:CAMPEP_0176467712 /NCGR_PEP_ID=MMETSP0127-20121128/38612_1 /TAXON_ID=938130 /ORGANISM="Platyophrya macrostoma, Strain WH" /LENGTH=165 /DNA_ID=CAMNT_0017861045 /DNA_START=32 /DNA_END=525 /DNA_ORIENTATION=-